MSYREVLSQSAVAISISESPDMSMLGLSEDHLRDAMVEIARHLLALGARLVYGGDLRANGFSELLFELIARHRRDADEGDVRVGVANYLAWPVHIGMANDVLLAAERDVAGLVDLVCLDIDGRHMTMPLRHALPGRLQPSELEWTRGLTAMRETMRAQTNARIVLGGRVANYKGSMPGIAEEALLSLEAHQPLFLLGGFGGCTRDITETLGMVEPWAASRPAWPGRDGFKGFRVDGLCNGLSPEENGVLARTPHIDQAVALVLRGLLQLQSENEKRELKRVHDNTVQVDTQEKIRIGNQLKKESDT
jgi:SLOG cluster2